MIFRPDAFADASPEIAFRIPVLLDVARNYRDKFPAEPD
jgi:hypothetical protein